MISRVVSWYMVIIIVRFLEWPIFVVLAMFQNDLVTETIKKSIVPPCSSSLSTLLKTANLQSSDVDVSGGVATEPDTK